MDYTRFLASYYEDKYSNNIQFSLPNLQNRFEQPTLFEKLINKSSSDFIEPSAFLNLSHEDDNTVRNPDDFIWSDSNGQNQLSPRDDYAKDYFQAVRSQGSNLFQKDGMKESQDFLGSMETEFWGSNEDPQALQNDNDMTKNIECGNSVHTNGQSVSPLQIPSLIIPALETQSPLKDRNRLRADSTLSESTNACACDNIFCQSPVELSNQRRKSQTTQSKSKKKKNLENANTKQENTGMSPPYLKLKKSKSEFDQSTFGLNTGMNMLNYYAELHFSQGNDMLYNSNTNPFTSYAHNYFDRSAEKDERNENSSDISSCLSTTHPALEDSNNFMNSNSFPPVLQFLNQTQPSRVASYDLSERLTFTPDTRDFFSNSTTAMMNQTPIVKKIGPLTVEERQAKIDKYLQKRKQRSWNKKISYDCRKRVADGRLRIRGRFVTKSHAFAILEADGVAYDPNKITMAEIKEYLTKKFMDHPHTDEHEKMKHFDEEYFKFDGKEDGEGEMYYLNEEFGMSPIGSDEGKCGFPYN